MASDDTDSIIPAVVVIVIGFIVSLISYFDQNAQSNARYSNFISKVSLVGYPELVGH